jgi:hypothetical protein
MINPKARWPFAEHAAEPEEPCEDVSGVLVPRWEHKQQALFATRYCQLASERPSLLAADESLLRVAQLPDGRGRRG